MAQKTYGSGHFGEWAEDGFGLPAYRYTCDQVHDPAAITPVDPHWRRSTDHSHQVGNDRIVGVASNYGYIQVRQDEGSPKFLNDYDPAGGHYAGGFGYLTDGRTVLSTFYPGTADTFERIFGIGYLRKTVLGGDFSVDQVIFAPFGDDPLLISQVTVTNHGQASADLRWVEYWGCQAIQFSHRAQVMAVISRGKQHVQTLRRKQASYFSQHFSLVGKLDGLLNCKRFRGYPFSERVSWGIDQILLATVAKKTTGGALQPPVPQAGLEDLNPPATFLISLDAPADGVATDEVNFFGQGGVLHPDGLAHPFPKSVADTGGSALLLERHLTLQSGENRTLFFAYGYLPEGVQLDKLVEKYRRDLAGLWKHSCEAWKVDCIHLSVPEEPWVERELAWHNYYLRSAMTYDSFFKEHILSQGNVYQYVIGFQGAGRDPLQHALPFIYSQPEIVKEVLRYTLKEVLPDGEIPYAVTGRGMRMAVPFKPSDLEMWLLWLASEYVLATRDAAFLGEVLPTFPLYGTKAGHATVRKLLMRCYRHMTSVTGTGKHGLMRLSNGDWNDGAVVGFVPKEQHEAVRLHGESVLNAAFATYTLESYAQLLDYSGESPAAVEVRAWAEGQRKAVREQWMGKWFRRGWLSESLGWIGEDVMWLEPQPWAIIGGAATPEQTKQLVDNIDKLMCKPSPIGAMLMNQSLKQIASSPGDLTNAAVWPSINGTLVWALARVDGQLAWEEWKKNSLACHAEAYPQIWYGIWSGPDTYNSVFSKYPGQTYFDEKFLQDGQSENLFGTGANWTDFPVMNLHPHAWPLYDTVKLIGAEFNPEGLVLAPVLSMPTYRFASPLLGLEKTSHGYSGWYAPLQAGEWKISLRLAASECSQFSHLEINGQSRPLELGLDGVICFSGKSMPGQPLRWSLK